jgi:starvation-inducible DNA-binding protein
MIATTLPAPDTARLAAASGLQKLRPELVALSLDAKQAHWNMTGAAFLPLHALTDEIADDTRAWADRIAERAVALGFYVNARPATVAAAAGSFPLGRVTDIETITELVELVELIDGVTATTRRILDPLASADAVGHDITVGILEGLEKYRWMLTAQTS